MVISIDLRRRVVAAYKAGLTGTYSATAKLFGIGRATVGRVLRRQRETGDVELKPRGGNNPRVVDLEWLQAHAEAEPDARLVDRVDAWVAVGGRRISLQAMSLAMHAIGWTHKKKRQSHVSETPRWSKRAGKPSSRISRSSTSND